MKLRRHAAAIAAALTVITIPAVMTAAPAEAALGIQVCGVSASPVCLNGWGGGSAVKTYSANAYNDNFVYDFVKGRCAAGSYLTTANCPISGVPAGLSVVQIKETYVNNGSYECVGDSGGGPGSSLSESFDHCNSDQTGYGGDYGTIFVLQGNGCPGPATIVVNSHWSSNWTSGFGALSPQGGNWGSNGIPFYLNIHKLFCYQESDIT